MTNLEEMIDNEMCDIDVRSPRYKAWSRALEELKSIKEENLDLLNALVLLMDRLDAHFGGKGRSEDWKEQEDAREVIAKYTQE